jgi:hypothetical protein
MGPHAQRKRLRQLAKMVSLGSRACSRASSAGQTFIQGIALFGRQPARDLAHDRNDLLHDITAGAAGSTSQQIPHRGADLRLGVSGPQTPNRPDTCCPPRSRNCSRRRRRAAGASGCHPDPGLPSRPARQGDLRVGMGAGEFGRSAALHAGGPRAVGQCSPDPGL